MTASCEACEWEQEAFLSGRDLTECDQMTEWPYSGPFGHLGRLGQLELAASSSGCLLDKRGVR